MLEVYSIIILFSQLDCEFTKIHQQLLPMYVVSQLFSQMECVILTLCGYND